MTGPAGTPDAPYTFVGDLAEAIAAAKEAAGDKDVSLTAGALAGQALAAGLVDQLDMYVAPMVFGAGIRFFGEHEVPTTLLGDPEVIPAERVTHLRYTLRSTD